MRRDSPKVPAPGGGLPGTPRGVAVLGSAADRRVLAVLCLASVVAVVNFMAVSPLLPVIARDLRSSVPLVGQVTAAITLLSAVAGLAIGPITDRSGTRRLMVGGVVCVALNLIGTGLAPTYPLLLLLAVVGGLGDAILFGLPLAIAGTRFEGAARRRAIGWTSAALSLGGIVGVPVIAAVGGALGWRAALVGVGLLALTAAPVVAAWLPADAVAADAPLRLPALLAAYQPLLRHRPTLVLYAVNGLRAAAWIGVLTYLGAFLADRFGLDPSGVGLAYMVTGVGVFLGNALGASRFGPIPLRWRVAGGAALQGALLAALFALPLALVTAVVVLFVTAFAGAVTFVAVATLLIDESHAGAGTTMVLNGSVFNLGSAVGAASGGGLLAVGGYEAAGIGLASFAVLAALLVLATGRSAPPHRLSTVGDG